MELKQYQAKDLALYYQLVRNAETMRYISGKALSEQETVAKFATVLDYNRGHQTTGHYRVYNQGVYIGYGKLIANNHQLEVGYMLLPEYVGRGFGKQLLAMLIEKAAHRGTLIAIIQEGNMISRNLLEQFYFVEKQTFQDQGQHCVLFERHV